MSSPNVNTAAAHPPSKTALLLLDYHNHIVDMISPPEQKVKVLSAASALLKAARDNSITIAHCLIDKSAEPVETSKLKQRWEQSIKLVIASAPEKFDEHADLAPLPAGPTAANEFTVTKVVGCVSAMKTGGFVSTLREKLGVQSLVVCGVSSSGAVLSTARDAADLGFVTTVVEDACWDPKPDVHTAVLRDILPMTAYTTDLKGGLDLLKGAAGV
ncbi:hypothetical protein QQS21_007039 [Conoideocrella luteorostrata]|uniref:Isochorismatase-like domain-containing protein n=1 Tax=Conoideocrella luteorostrata TaxID=1105319 RepID=A0AAJ0CPG4_9HYPO|nr:hypothetical protein QQS21_007039 [Conoideocrella luteorostrata]